MRGSSRRARYECTFAGLPVLGGDLVVHTAADGTVKGTDKAARATLTLASTTAVKTGESAKAFALGRAKAQKARTAKVDSARKVVWAASGSPVPAWESVVGGTQQDGTPGQSHVITDATKPQDVQIRSISPALDRTDDGEATLLWIAERSSGC